MMLSFNYTAAIQDNTLHYFTYPFIIVIIINILSLLYYILNVGIDIRIGKFDTNIIKIHQFIYITCPVGSIIIIIQKILTIFGISAGYSTDNYTFQILNNIRSATVFPGLICLIAFVIERFCATWFLKDYEQKKRDWIGYSIGIGLYTSGVILATTFAYVNTPIYHVIFLLVLNTFSCIGNIINYKINRMYYKACQRSFDGSYSLTERYQISDNIHFSFFFNMFSMSIGFFTILCPILMLLSSIDTIPWVYRNTFIILFEITYGVYTILTPYIIYKFNIRWHQEFRKIFGKFISHMRNRKIEVSETINENTNNVRLRNTFGIEMNIELNKQSDTYFDQLQSSWKR